MARLCFVCNGEASSVGSFGTFSLTTNVDDPSSRIDFFSIYLDIMRRSVVDTYFATYVGVAGRALWFVFSTKRIVRASTKWELPLKSLLAIYIS